MRGLSPFSGAALGSWSARDHTFDSALSDSPKGRAYSASQWTVSALVFGLPLTHAPAILRFAPLSLLG